MSKTTNIIIIHFHDTFNTIDYSHIKLNMENNGEVCTFLFTKNFNKITTKIHVLQKCNQIANQLCNIQH